MAWWILSVMIHPLQRYCCFLVSLIPTDWILSVDPGFLSWDVVPGGWFLDLFVLDMSVCQHSSNINHAYTCIIITFRYSCCILCHISLFVVSCYLVIYISPSRCVCLISPYRVSPLSRKCLSFLPYSPPSYILVDDGCFCPLPTHILGWESPLSYILTGTSLDSACLFSLILDWPLVTVSCASLWYKWIIAQ